RDRVNTIAVGEKTVGYNTDYHGFGLTLEFEGFNPSDKTCAVLGSGGSSRAVVSYLEDKGAKSISIVSRDPDSAAMKYPGLLCVSIDRFEAKDFDLVVNTTPVGMSPKAGFSPITKSQLNGAGFVMDLIYNPSETLLLKYARELDIPCLNGLYMLVAQAVMAEQIWNQKQYDRQLIHEIFEELQEL
ncbi:MAG: hypothetical protein N2376_14545, partial [Clostridia bacterium]|nr:hypothetical protein [Clostridia bacterium]